MRLKQKIKTGGGKALKKNSLKKPIVTKNKLLRDTIYYILLIFTSATEEPSGQFLNFRLLPAL